MFSFQIGAMPFPSMLTKLCPTDWNIAMRQLWIVYMSNLGSIPMGQYLGVSMNSTIFIASLYIRISWNERSAHLGPLMRKSCMFWRQTCSLLSTKLTRHWGFVQVLEDREAIVNQSPSAAGRLVPAAEEEAFLKLHPAEGHRFKF